MVRRSKKQPVEIEVISGIPALKAAIDKATEKVLVDLSPLFELLASDFYKDEKRIFQRKTVGVSPRYQKLSATYERTKARRYGFVYPILFATGRLASSLLSRDHSEAVNLITKDSMVLGTAVPYAVFHHSEKPRTKIPRRPLWDETDTSPLYKRWMRTTDAFMEKQLKRYL